jgi:hypothetical protein
MKMDAVRNQLNRPILVGVVGFIIGILIGLIVLGWWLWPVKWTNASPVQLQKDYQADFLRMAVDSYIKTQDAQAAKARWDYLGNKASDTLANVKNEPLKLKAEEITAFEKAVAAPTGEETAEAKKRRLVNLDRSDPDVCGYTGDCRRDHRLRPVPGWQNQRNPHTRHAGRGRQTPGSSHGLQHQ